MRPSMLPQIEIPKENKTKMHYPYIPTKIFATTTKAKYPTTATTVEATASRSKYLLWERWCNRVSNKPYAEIMLLFLAFTHVIMGCVIYGNTRMLSRDRSRRFNWFNWLIWGRVWGQTWLSQHFILSQAKNLNVGLISTRDIRHEASNVTNVYLKVVGRKDVRSKATIKICYIPYILRSGAACTQ